MSLYDIVIPTTDMNWQVYWLSGVSEQSLPLHEQNKKENNTRQCLMVCDWHDSCCCTNGVPSIKHLTQEQNSTSCRINPFSSVDANMHPIIACAKGPNDAYVSSVMVVHTLTDPSVATREQYLCIFQGIPCSPLSILWLLNRLSWPLSRREIKHQILTRLRTSCTTNRGLQ